MEYVVQHGDTLAKIAETYLGDASLWPAIAQQNGFTNPDLIYPGLKLDMTGLVGEISDRYAVTAKKFPWLLVVVGTAAGIGMLAWYVKQEKKKQR